VSESAEEALQSARAHLRQATLEGLEAARALLRAAMHTSGLAEPTGESWLGNLQSSLEDLIAGLRENGSFSLPAALTEPLSLALEAEIKRWEQRSQTDPDARPVLRAFLGLRELLWELGMRHDPAPTSEESPPSPSRHGPARPKRDRVQRFNVED
jgi:hypothetical protein